MSKQPSDPSRAEASEPAGPLDGIYQMQREILKLNLEASSYTLRLILPVGIRPVNRFISIGLHGIHAMHGNNKTALMFYHSLLQRKNTAPAKKFQ